MFRFNALRGSLATMLGAGCLAAGTLAGAAEPTQIHPAQPQQDFIFSVAPPPVFFTRPAGVVRAVDVVRPIEVSPVTVVRPMVTAPAPNAVWMPAGVTGPAMFTIALAGAPAAEDVPPPPAVPVPAPPGAVARPILQRFVPQGAMQVVNPAGAVETGKFWLGMMCLPAPEVLRSQLALPAGTGLVVHEVAPEGPAATAGVQRNDILVQADGKALPDAAVLGQIANEKGAVAVEFKVLRGGKEQILKVTPAERPAQPFNVFVPQGGDQQAIEQWIGHLRQLAQRPNAVPGRPLRLRILRPAHVGGAVQQQQPFPADLHVTVTREGNNPWKVEVRQGDKNWQVTSDDLAKLPETIRPYIEGMVGNMSGGRPVGNAGVVEGFQIPEVEFQPGAKVEVEGAPPVGGANVPPPAPMPPPPGTAQDRGAQIDQLRDQLKDLQRRLEKIGEEKK